jgi:protein tyrosine/serine phosphatase
VIRYVMGAEAEYLETSLRVIDEQHGGAEAYVRDVLGVDRTKQEAIEKRLFE